jgi:hypothetical protein
MSLESYVTTDGQSVSLSWYKAPIRGLRPDFFLRSEYGIRLTVTFLIPWGALSDEWTGLSFVCAAVPCQRSLSGVRVPWDSRPYFTVSDLRLPFSSPPTTDKTKGSSENWQGKPKYSEKSCPSEIWNLLRLPVTVCLSVLFILLSSVFSNTLDLYRRLFNRSHSVEFELGKSLN